jgi:hypothetical protein
VSRPDFAAVRLRPQEWPIIREAYAETYPVRPLLNHIDELREALAVLRPGLVLDLRYANEDDDKEAMRSRIETVETALASVEGA